jgi:hypothetical protein
MMSIDTTNHRKKKLTAIWDADPNEEGASPEGWLATLEGKFALLYPGTSALWYPGTTRGGGAATVSAEKSAEA